MGKNKRWNGYKSWSYLDPTSDFESYPLEKQLNRFPEYDFGLSKDQEQRVQEIVEKNIVISLHDHLNVFPLEDITRPRQREFKAFEGLAHSCLDAVFENGLNHYPTSDQAINFLGMSQADYAHQDLVIPGLKVDDIIRARRENRVAMVFSIEELSSIGTNLDMVDLYFGLGLRAAGLVYNQSNQLGTGLNENRDGGLTDLGYDVVKRMNKTGVIVDIAHCSDLSCLEAIEASDKPVLISHRGSRELFNNSRMLPDEISLACAQKGGIIAVEAAGFAPRTEEHPEASVECTLDHIKYLIDVVGVDHVGVGPDTFWGDHPHSYKEEGERRIPRPSDTRPRPLSAPPKFDPYELRIKTPPEHPYNKGLENPADIINIARGLVRDGYSDNEIAKVIGLNGLRLARECWPS